MVAGTKYRGQFEERIKGGSWTKSAAPRNIHHFHRRAAHHRRQTGAARRGEWTLPNIFQARAQSRRAPVTSAPPTLGEYRKYIEIGQRAPTAASNRSRWRPRRFEDTILILKGIRGKVRGAPTRVEFTDDALEAAAKPSPSATSPRASCPDKAIDILDEAGKPARASSRCKRPPEIEENERGHRGGLFEEGGGHQQAAFRRSGQIPRRGESGLRPKPSRADRGVEEKPRTKPASWSDEEEMLQVVADWTGIPLSRHGAEGEAKKLLKLESELQHEVIGQDRATTEKSFPRRCAVPAPT